MLEFLSQVSQKVCKVCKKKYIATLYKHKKYVKSLLPLFPGTFTHTLKAPTYKRKKKNYLVWQNTVCLEQHIYTSPKIFTQTRFLMFVTFKRSSLRMTLSSKFSREASLTVWECIKTEGGVTLAGWTLYIKDHKRAIPKQNYVKMYTLRMYTSLILVFYLIFLCIWLYLF